MNRKLLPICLMLALAACQAATSPSPIPTHFPNIFQGEAKVGNYEMQITCRGAGEPTIILENGQDIQSWTPLHLQRFSSITRTCLYPRVGMTGETANPAGPRTVLDQVKELHALLQQTGVPGPYILVGHSYGGYNLVLYTNQYPDEVEGLVCVDCRYATYDEIMLAKMKRLFEANPILEEVYSDEIYNTWLDKSLVPESWKLYKERLDCSTSADQVLAVTSLGNRPLVVLVAHTKGENEKYMNARIANALDEAWLEMNTTLSKLSTQSRMEIVEGTTHLSIPNDPVVAKAIKEVYEKVK